MPDSLPAFITRSTVLPVIAAPMFLVSGPELVLAACRAGVIGSFPAPNARTIETLDEWYGRINTELQDARTQNHKVAPWAANVIVHSTYKRREAEMDLLRQHQPPIVITALGSPVSVVDVVHGYGGLVLADVNSVRFARKAAETGVDGLVLVAAGAGGHTGQMTGFAFVDAVREFWDGIVVLGGGISTGRGIRAARALGADLAYMGTRFIPTVESLAPDPYRQMLVEADSEDIVLSDALTGIPANWLRASLIRSGHDPDNMQKSGPIDLDDPYSDKKAWKDTWSAGQGVGSIKKVQTVAELVADLRAEYATAVQRERQDPWANNMIKK